MWTEYVVTCVYGFLTGVFLLIFAFLYGFDLTISVLRFAETIGKRPRSKWIYAGEERKKHFLAKEMMEGFTSNTKNVQAMDLSSYCLFYPYFIEDTARYPMEAEDTSRNGVSRAGHAEKTSPPHTQKSVATSGANGSFRATGGFLGEPIRCKIQLQKTEIHVYEQLSSRGAGAGGNAPAKHRLGNQAEHFRGKILLSSFTVDRKKPVTNAPKVSAPSNRILFISSKTKKPLLTRRMDLTQQFSPEANIFSESESDEPISFFKTITPSSIKNSPPGLDLLGLTNDDSPVNNIASCDLHCWKAMMIEFESPFEAEQWKTVMEGLVEVEAWRRAVKKMPNTDTLNVLLYRLLFPSTRRSGVEMFLRKSIQEKLAEIPALKFPRFIKGTIELDDFILGVSLPSISEISNPVKSLNGEVGFDFNLLYKGEAGGFTLYFKFALFFHGIPIPHFILSIKLLELQATIHISIGAPPSKKIWIAGHRPPVLRVQCDQGCASGKGLLHRILTSLPDLSGICGNLLRLYLFSEMILPEMDDYALLSFVSTGPVQTPESSKPMTFDRARAAKESAKRQAMYYVKKGDKTDERKTRKPRPLRL